MPTKLTGIPSFAYLGVEAPQPPNIVQVNRAPTITDFLTYNTGDLWLNIAGLSAIPQVLPTSSDIWMLVSKQRNIGRWVNFGAGAAVATTYVTDAGNAVPAANVLNVFGGTAGRDINTTGAGNTIHVELNNAITLGDLAVLGAGANALSATTGDINIAAGNLKLPNTNGAGSQGTISLGGVRYFHNFGGSFVTPNLFIGNMAGNLTNTSINSIGIGFNALQNLGTSIQNTAFGTSTLNALTNSAVGSNAAFGMVAGQNLLTGSQNVLLGFGAGFNYTGAESSNIVIASNSAAGGAGGSGVVGDNNTIRIGVHNAVATAGQQNRCFIAGIRGITTGVNDAVAVLIDSASQLGTVSSSKRYKENIQDMEDASELIMDLRPVVFNYKKHPDVPAWGLIAEEVAEIFPQLVVYDKEGQCETVKYHELSILLLNELQKVSKRVEELERKLNE